jgi:hypothetical protein
MKTRSGWFYLRGLFLLSVGFTLGTMLCGSAFAGPIIDRAPTTVRPYMAQDMPAQKMVVYYVMSSASAIPMPISYCIGGVLTTPSPIEIIGRGQTTTR